MINLFKDTFKTFILDPLAKRTSSIMDRRSSSIIVESKVKKIQSKRGQSETKANTKTKLNTTPQQVQFQTTPIKNGGKDTKRFYFDEMETNKKFQIPLQNQSMIASNSNPRWLDYVSDIDSGRQSNRLLPNSQDLKTPKKSIIKVNVDQGKVSKAKNIIQNCKQVEPNQSNQSKTKQQDTIINWLQGNNPQYYIIKLCKEQQQKPKKPTVNEIKKKRLEQYQQQKRTNIKGNPKHLCIICEDPAQIKSEYHHLACTHRIHKVCADLIKWKPRMKCYACQRKSIKDLSLKSSFGFSRMSSLSRGKSGKKVRKL